MSRHFTVAERKAAVARLLAGERPAALSRELRVTTSALRLWRSRYRAELAPSSTPPAPSPSFAPAAPAAPELEPRPLDALASSPATAAPSPGLAEALAAAQGVEPPAPGSSAPPLAGAPIDASTGARLDAVPTDPGAFTVEHVVAVGEIVNGLVVRGVAVAKGVTLTEDKVEALIAFSDRERRALEMFAPYALPYVPQVLAQFPRYAAWGFVAIYGAALVGRVQAVVALAPETPSLVPTGGANELPREV